MATVAELNVKIGADIASFQAGMRKMESALKDTGTRLKSAGKTMSLAITAPILGVGAAAVKTAGDVAEMQSKFQVVFGSAAASVRAEMDEFAKATGRSRFQLQGMAADLGAVTSGMGFSAEEAGEMTTTLTKLAVDLGSIHNVPMEDALVRLRGALIGAHENVATFGVILNESTLKAEMARMGADKLTGAMLEQAKVQARMNIIMRGTAYAQGDATNTAGSFANQVQGLRNAVYDLGVTIGQILLPFAQSLVGRLRDLVDYAQNLNPQVQRMAILIAGAAAAAGPLVFSLGGIASGFSAILRAITLTMGLFNPYVAGMAAIAAIGVGLYKNWDKVGETFKGLEQKVKDGLKPLTDWWDENRETIIRKIADLWVAIGAAFDAALTALSTAISAGLNILLEFWGQHGQSIVTILGTAFQLMLDFATAYFKNMAEVIKLGMELLKPGWDGEWDAIKNIAENNLNLVGTAVETLMGVVDKEMDMTDDPINKKMGIESARTAIENALNAVKGMFSSTAQSAEDNLAGDTGSVASAAGGGKDAIMGLRGEIEGLDAMPYKDGSIAGLIALIGGAPEDKTSLTGVAAAAKESIDTLFKSIPTELSVPDWKVLKPENDVSVLGFWQNLKTAIGDAADEANRIGWLFGDVSRAVNVLYNSKVPGWMADMFRYAEGVAAVVSGFDALTKLLDLQTWKDFGESLVDIFKALGGIVVKIWEWVAGSNALAGTQAVGGAAGAGAGAAGAAGGGAGGGGLFAAGGALAGITGGAALIGGFAGLMNWLGGYTGSTLAGNGFDITQYGGGNLAGLLGGNINTGGLNFGDPWLGGGGRMAGGQTINIHLDGRTIAAATVPHLSQELEIYGTNF